MNEQDRADQLSREIDALQRGERTPDGDPLLALADLLAKAPVKASPEAQAKFQRKVAGWFVAGSLAPIRPDPRGLQGRWWTQGVAWIVAVLAGISVLIVVIVHSHQPTQSLTPTPSATYTLAPTLTLTATVFPSPASATPDSRVIEGRITSIQSSSFIIQGLSIHMNGSVRRFCVGDLVKMTAAQSADGTWHADAASVVIEYDSCPITPSPVPTAITIVQPPIRSSSGSDSSGGDEKKGGGESEAGDSSGSSGESH